MDPIDQGRKLISGDEATKAVQVNAMAMFNQVIKPGDVVVYRREQGLPTTGFRLLTPAWIKNGKLVCEIEGIAELVPCDRVTPFAGLTLSRAITQTPVPVATKSVGNLF